MHAEKGDGERIRRGVGERDTFQARDNVAEKLHPLRRQLNVDIRDARDLAPGAREALHQYRSYRVASTDEDDRNPIGGPQD